MNQPYATTATQRISFHATLAFVVVNILLAVALFATPRVQFDVHPLVACRDVTTEEFARTNPTDRLIEGVYGEGAPEGARRTVQTFVSNLRSELGDTVTSVGSGYEFRVGDSSLDVERFTTLVGSGQERMVDDTKAHGVLQPFHCERGFAEQRITLRHIKGTDAARLGRRLQLVVRR